MSFFKTAEYKRCQELRTRLLTINTKNNYALYFSALEDAIGLCDRAYKSVGYNAATSRYAWVDVLPGPVAPEMARYKSGLTGETFYVAVDGSMVVFKLGGGGLCTYTGAEVSKIKDTAPADIKVIHEIKSKMEGKIL